MNEANIPRSECEREHDFVLVLDHGAVLTDDAASALFAAGCDDATLSVRGGRVYVTFTRTAPSLKHAILSAIRDVRNAAIGADVLRIDDCDLVTQADIAKRIGRTRSLVNQYITGERGPGQFPPPACNLTSGKPLWYWCEVAYWLWQNDMVKESVAREARDVAMINNVLEAGFFRHANANAFDEVEAAILTPSV